jgi:hypothetical protein
VGERPVDTEVDRQCQERSGGKDQRTALDVAHPPVSEAAGAEAMQNPLFSRGLDHFGKCNIGRRLITLYNRNPDSLRKFKK